MKVELLYGKATIEASVPSDCRETLIRKQPRAPLPDPHAAIMEALIRPIGAPPSRIMLGANAAPVSSFAISRARFPTTCFCAPSSSSS